MTIVDNDSARIWLTETLHVPRGTIEQLERFEILLREEMTRQNLIAASTFDTLWARHYVDSAQLLLFTRAEAEAGSEAVSEAGSEAVSEVGPWLDLGAGAGFPGIVIAALDSDRPVHLVESRALRCDFLSRVATDLGLSNVTIHHNKLERVAAFNCAIISARAFAPLPKLLDLADRFATKRTIWVLPKGKNAVNELASLSKSWQRLFHVEQSLTDGESHILVGHGKA